MLYSSKYNEAVLAIVFTLFLQTAGGIWWLSSLNSKVTANCTAIEGNKDVNSIVAVHTAQITAHDRNMDRLVTKLDKYITIQLENTK